MIQTLLSKYFSKRILKLNICSVLHPPTLKPYCSSAMIFSASSWSLLQHNFTLVADKADGSVVLAQLQVSFLLESVDQGPSPFD